MSAVTAVQRNEKRKIEGDYAVVTTDYTRRLGPDARKAYNEEASGDAIIVCIKDDGCWSAFDMLPEEEAEMKVVLAKHEDDTSCSRGSVVIRLCNKNPFCALDHFVSLFGSDKPRSYCGCFHGAADSVYLLNHNAVLGNVVAFVFDCESGYSRRHE